MSGNNLQIVNEMICLMQDAYGIDVGMYDGTFLEKSIGSRCAIKGINKPADYLQYLSTNTIEADHFLATLNITYSEFFRNALAFAHLEQWILPKLIEEKANGGELRIWSAGCSTGQEPYSIAMVLEEFQKVRSKEVRYRIFATDIAESELAIARKGEYSERAIQNIKIKHFKDFFDQKGENYLISSRVKKHVNFSVYNLLDPLSSCPEESIFGNFDLVFCCNLLFYYQPEFQQRIFDKLLGRDGTLLSIKYKRIARGCTTSIDFPEKKNLRWI
jgi:chemotaxis protein methyltransferase CheR